ncbi:MAG: YbjN domain-containing protein [Myxococcales bacterium]|nr:YbjN domain-containing protein [Myxococcales bacterium]
MDLCPRYIEPIVEYESKLNIELYQSAVKLFESKMYEESFRVLLNYINQEMAKSCEKEHNHWVIPHGSLILEIRITPDAMLEIRAPFVKLPPDRRAPLLRQALEFNTHPLTLSRLVLQDDGLTFVYRAPLSLAEPFKTYGIIHEICINGDSSDDEYITKFGALPLREKQVTYLPKQQVDRAWQVYQELLAEAQRYSDYYTQKRWHGFDFEIQGIALMRIDHAVSPQGYLRTRLERSVNHVWAQRSAEEIANLLRRDLDEYRRIERAAFDRDFYKTTFFVSAKKTAEIGACQKNMAQRWSWAQEDRAHRNAQGVAFCYLFAAYNLLYSFFVPPKLHAEIVGTLRAMGGKGWEEAGELAWANFQKIMDPAYA